jgi:diaminopimelate epimerase
MKFIKMHGLGNDFAIFDARKAALPELDIVALSNRKTGIGFDQMAILRVSDNAADNADCIMDIYNGDGSRVGACGNMTRCVADILIKESGKEAVTIQTDAGLLKCCASDKQAGWISVDMGVPKVEWNSIPLAYECDSASVPIEIDGYGQPFTVNVGNPHAVFFIDDVTAVKLETIGPSIETHDMFPERINVEFAQIIDQQNIRMRVWERGTGITQACGTGACATLIAAASKGLSVRSAYIQLDGGALHIEWREDDGHIIMSGPVAYVYEGCL